MFIIIVFVSRKGIERELVSRADQRVLRWFGHVERMVSTVCPEGC